MSLCPDLFFKRDFCKRHTFLGFKMMVINLFLVQNFPFRSIEKSANLGSCVFGSDFIITWKPIPIGSMGLVIFTYIWLIFVVNYHPEN